MRKISHKMRVSWMLLRANGHSCLSSLLLFSSTNWDRETKTYGPRHTNIVIFNGSKKYFSVLDNIISKWAHSPCCKHQGNGRQNTPWCPTPGDPEDTGSGPDQDYCYSDTQTHSNLRFDVVQYSHFHSKTFFVVLTEKPSFLNSLAQRERLRSLLRPLSLSVSNAACLSPWSMSLCSCRIPDKWVCEK